MSKCLESWSRSDYKQHAKDEHKEPVKTEPSKKNPDLNKDPKKGSDPKKDSDRKKDPDPKKGSEPKKDPGPKKDSGSEESGSETDDSDDSTILEVLASIDELWVDQEIHSAELMSGHVTQNRYTVRTKENEIMFFARETTSYYTRRRCGVRRPFDIYVEDYGRNDVIQMERPLACQCCCCPCWLQNMDVSAPPGHFIGSVLQKWSCWKPKFVIMDENDEVVLRIKGPCCTCALCNKVHFGVFTKDHSEKVGEITKHWTNILQEIYTSADCFSVNFQMDMDVKLKAIIFSAVFLITTFTWTRSDRTSIGWYQEGLPMEAPRVSLY